MRKMEIRQEPLPNMELIDIVEQMSPFDRIQYKEKLLSEISDRETLVHLINEVNEIEGADPQSDTY